MVFCFLFVNHRDRGTLPWREKYSNRLCVGLNCLFDSNNTLNIGRELNLRPKDAGYSIPFDQQKDPLVCQQTHRVSSFLLCIGWQMGSAKAWLLQQLVNKQNIP
jgi:hypothetical protein